MARWTSRAHRTAATHACELDQKPVAGDPDDSAAVFGYLWIDEFAPVCLPLGERALLVGTDKPAVAGYIGRKNGHQSPLQSLVGQSVRPFVIASRTVVEASLRPQDCGGHKLSIRLQAARGVQVGFGHYGAYSMPGRPLNKTGASMQ